MPPKIPQIIKCDSEWDLKLEINDIQTDLLRLETEESWERIATALLKLSALANGGACEFSTAFTSALRPLSRAVTSAASSERTRLSAASIQFICAAATGLGKAFEPLLPLYFPTLLSLCARPNKVFIARAKTGITTIIEQTQLPSILSFLIEPLKDKSVSMRLIAIEGLLACLNCFNPPDLEKESRAREIETAIKITAQDASGDVRKVSKQVFGAYKILLPDRVDSFAAPLSPTARKYLDIKPKPLTTVPTLPRPESSQSIRSRSASTSVRPASSLAMAAKHVEPPSRTDHALSRTRTTSTSSAVSQTSDTHPTSSATNRPTFSRRADSRNEARKNIAEKHTAERRAMLPPALPSSSTMTRSQSAHQIPSRPPDRVAARPVSAQLSTSQPAPAAGPSTGAQPQRTQSESAPSGPSRTTSSTELPTHQKTTSGPIRPAQELVVPGPPVKERPTGGARRVPLPPQTQPVQVQPRKVVPDPRKHVADKPHQAPNARKPVADIPKGGATASTAKPAVARKPPIPKLSRSVSSVEPRGISVLSRSQSSSTALASSTSSSKAPTASTRGGGVMKPTVSQLARVKATVAARKPSVMDPKTRTKRIASATKALAVSSVKSKIASKRVVSASHKEVEKKDIPVIPVSDNVSRPTTPISAPLSPGSEETAPSIGDTSSTPVQPVHEEAVPNAPSQDLLPVPLLASPLTASPRSPKASALSEPLTATSPVSPETDLTVSPETDRTPTQRKTPVKSIFSTDPSVLMRGTPISSLVSSIQQGFMFTPHSPLSPPQSYARSGPDFGDITECWSPPTWPTHMMGDISTIGPAEELGFNVMMESTPKQAPVERRRALLTVDNNQ